MRQRPIRHTSGDAHSESRAHEAPGVAPASHARSSTHTATALRTRARYHRSAADDERIHWAA